MSKKTKLLLLIVWSVLCTLIYYTAVRAEFEPIVPIYGALSILAAAAFLLVNGGLRSIEGANEEPEPNRKRQKRMRYKNAPDGERGEQRRYPFRMDPGVRRSAAQLLLIFFLPLAAVLAVDYVLMAFLPDYI